MTKDELREKANDLPLAPGVYLMMDSGGQVIYVGKAKKLKNRVSQYFQDTASHNSKTKMMVSQEDRFDTILVRSEFEALVLENSLIKRHMPRFNILLKDDKGYPFVRLEKGADYLRFSLVSRAEEDGLIRTECTEIITRDGLKRNGCLRYTILPIKNALALCYERQMEKAGQAMERQRAQARAERLGATFTPAAGERSA